MKSQVKKKALRLVIILVIVGAIIYEFIWPNVIAPCRAKYQFEQRYGVSIKKAKDETSVESRKKYITDDGIYVNVFYDEWGNIVSDSYSDFYYRKAAIDFVQSHVQKYYDDALYIDNFVASGKAVGRLSYTNYETFEEYCNSLDYEEPNCNHYIWVYLSEKDDISKVDDMLNEISEAVTYQKVAVVVMQVPDNIYEINKGIDCYHYEDGLWDKFRKEIGTPDFRTITYNDYIVGAYNLAKDDITGLNKDNIILVEKKHQ